MARKLLVSSSQKNLMSLEVVTFDGKGKYEEPKLVWAHSTGLTSLIFLDSEKFRHPIQK